MPDRNNKAAQVKNAKELLMANIASNGPDGLASFRALDSGEGRWKGDGHITRTEAQPIIEHAQSERKRQKLQDASDQFFAGGNTITMQEYADRNAIKVEDIERVAKVAKEKVIPKAQELAHQAVDKGAELGKKGADKAVEKGKEWDKDGSGSVSATEIFNGVKKGISDFFYK